jgi:hypothetical protein
MLTHDRLAPVVTRTVNEDAETVYVAALALCVLWTKNAPPCGRCVVGTFEAMEGPVVAGEEVKSELSDAMSATTAITTASPVPATVRRNHRGGNDALDRGPW